MKKFINKVCSYFKKNIGGGDSVLLTITLHTKFDGLVSTNTENKDILDLAENIGSYLNDYDGCMFLSMKDLLSCNNEYSNIKIEDGIIRANIPLKNMDRYETVLKYIVSMSNNFIFTSIADFKPVVKTKRYGDRFVTYIYGENREYVFSQEILYSKKYL